MLSNHLEKEPTQNQAVMVNVTVWAVKDESCLIAGFPEQIKLDIFFFFSINKSRLCRAKLKIHYLLCMMLTSQQSPAHSVSIDEEKKNLLFCMMEKICNHLQFPLSIGLLLQGQPHSPHASVWDALNLFIFNLY